jgi:uncharacterized protein YyaL (SSP411 family)
MRENANRLARESSPYLVQHAHNPVDWYPWGNEAFARARGEERPIFLSIGYSACHWCHVMERESFEDPTVAGILNEHFVAIKVDREERPDVDAVYMSAAQAMTGSGGWPLSVFLTPELKPFFAGTYFPPERRWGMASFSEVLLAVADAWKHRRGELLDHAAALATQLAGAGARASNGGLHVDAMSEAALSSLAVRFDETWGGFDGAPKFPTPSRLFFLLHRSERDSRARAMLARTLDGMAGGGMYDWLGGGFHRYSVDEKWLVPHFEKMLYDNALLARVYGEAGTRFRRHDWLNVARDTADYLLAEMRGPEGGFYSSSDADSEGREGAYFTWTPVQVRDALPKDQADLVIALCGLVETGNFEGTSSVLRPRRELAEVAAGLGRAPALVAEQFVTARRALRAARDRRVPPAVDDKRVAGWNGMAAWALAYLGAALPEPRYLEAAQGATRFLLQQRSRDGRLARSWRNGVTSGAETLEDVAWTSAALVELYQADGDVAWLTAAKSLLAARLANYQDEDGALFDAPDDAPLLFIRPRAPFDQATPAPAGVLAQALLDLAALTEDDDLRAAADRALAADAATLARAPEACATLLDAAASAARPPQTLVIVGDPERLQTRRLLEVARRARPAACTLAVSPLVPVPPEVVGVVPIFAAREHLDGGAALAYWCEGGRCLLPTGDPDQLEQALSSAAR